MAQQIYIGTSGWHYNHWKGNFYPNGVKQKGFTEYYTRFFQTVEVNNSFYRLPTPETFSNWRDAVADEFIFAVKASRYITHMKKLKDPQEGLARLFASMNALEHKLGPVLFQLPPMWHLNLERLRDFLSLLPPYYRYTFEFRHPSWYTEEVLDLLRKHNAAFCIYELDGHMSPLHITADFVYVRLHGPAGKYAGSYTEEALQWWAQQCKNWQQQGLDVYVYFDNDQLGYAAFNALRLQEIVRLAGA
ncbi:DUF72 domain-containing protein [Pontibacter akesuensis]|uniref:Uncharacterized conserved protein YecE, DUF72 family n=1 Tax=Pontibacter akesuensis TaxID=388950 RepID=A0A1I7GTK0_9BACT|nr:DUF72 domain-containing protein [Pontibacter akesuensis]GHA55131.1 hypothetical protein GCM10007389_03150 [Pontibacter akesuensis]SFU51782.1 Uncharacterized conserved protein YecE, DUF72 family [Pontibacter akesuensis]